MLKKLVVFTSIAFLLSAQTISSEPIRDERKLYIGSNSTEAMLSYEGVVQYEGARAPSAKKMLEVVESQVEHTIGPMSMAEYKAVPKGDHILTNIRVISKTDKIHTIGYTYDGTIVLQNGPRTTYDIILAVDPTKIYEASFINGFSPCTDEHYQSEGDFWYFWNPYQKGCKLKKDVDFTVAKGKITRFANTKVSYPEYHNLPDANGNITVHILLGMDDNSTGRNPLTSSDINADNYRSMREYLIGRGYVAKKWTAAEISAIAKTTDGALPYVETIQKGKIIYRLFFGPSAIDEDSLAFHWFYKDAIENASVMTYSGHSGLGGHLDLESIEYNLGEPIKFNTKRYQIFFFDSCTSYKYYNQMYFERKVTSKDPRGTKKLDVFTNGLATFFHVMPKSSKAIAMAFEKSLGYAGSGNGFVSYQTLAKQIDTDNLFGITGDEDNEEPQIIK